MPVLNDPSKTKDDEHDLIAATQNLNVRARPEFVNYAKKAKRVDVKKLKENIWRELEELTAELESEAVELNVLSKDEHLLVQGTSSL
jgi:condensin complex subunit 2